VAEVDLSESIDQIEAPALVIGCTHDAVFPASLSRELAASLRSARYLELDSGHMAVVEAPAALARALSEFLVESAPTRA
jgi:pimeloyl-ACP methyl ester carboxylesterase